MKQLANLRFCYVTHLVFTIFIWSHVAAMVVVAVGTSNAGNDFGNDISDKCNDKGSAMANDSTFQQMVPNMTMAFDDDKDVDSNW